MSKMSQPIRQSETSTAIFVFWTVQKHLLLKDIVANCQLTPTEGGGGGGHHSRRTIQQKKLIHLPTKSPIDANQACVQLKNNIYTSSVFCYYEHTKKNDIHFSMKPFPWRMSRMLRQLFWIPPCSVLKNEYFIAKTGQFW